jgi:hypothetical protein
VKKFSLLALLTLLAACQKNPQPEGEALRARVVLSPEVSASCVLFEVRDAANHEVLASQWLPRGDGELTVAIFRGTLPADVELAARPYRDGTCEGGQAARTPNGAFETVTATFVQGAVTDATALSLRPGTDGDTDGYVDLSAGGSDCDDTTRVVNPGVQEACTDRVDRSCDGKRGCEASACGPTACVVPPTALALTVPTGSVVAGTCVAASVQVKDATRSATVVTSATPITLDATPSAGGTFFRDSSCTTSATGVTLPAGEGSAAFFFMPRGVGTVTLTAFSNGLSPASQGISVLPGAGSRLAFRTSLATTVTSGVCSPVVQVQLQDAQGNAVNVTATTQVALSSSPTDGFQFFTDAACTAPAVTATTIALGQSIASFYFKGGRAGSATLSASMGSVSVSHTATINSGAPAALLFPQSPLTLASGVCTPVTLEVKDSAGNPATRATNRTVGLTASAPPGITLASNDTCTNTTNQVVVSANQSSATFYVSGQGQGSVTVTASASGLTPAELSVTVTPGTPNKLAFVSGPQTLEKGACSAVATVEVRDAANNPTTFTANGQLTLTANPSAGTTFYSDETCTTSTLSLPVRAGQGRASFYFKDTTVETVTLTVAQSGLTSATQQQIITPLRPTELRFTTLARSAVAGVCSQVLTVEARAQGSVTTVTSATPVTLMASPDTDFKFYSNNTCTTEVSQVSIATGQSTASFYFKGTKVGTVGLTVTSSGVTTNATQDGTITAAVASKLQFVTAQHAATAGGCSPLVTVETTDAYGNIAPVSGGDKNVALSASGSPTDGNFRFYTDANCTSNVTNVNIANGQTRASFYFKGEKARTATITATVSGFNPTAYNQNHTITAAKATSLAFTTSAQTVLAGSCTAVTVERRDAFGNPAPDAVTLDLSASAEAEFFADASCSVATTEVSIPAGSTANFYFKGYTGGINATAPLTLTVAASGLGSTTQVQNIIPTVRSGTCDMSGGWTSNTCDFAPALASTSRAFLTFQATTGNFSSTAANVRCSLISTTEVRCERGDNIGLDVFIRWTVTEFPSGRGVNVQHKEVACAGDTTPVALSAVTRERSFLLLSSERVAADVGSAVPRLAELKTTTQAEIRKTGGCASAADVNHLQVVDYPGATVQRGIASLTSGTLTQLPLPTAVAPDRSILLYSYLYEGSGTNVCDRALRGELADNGATVRFSRGEGDTANCTGMQLTAISWEVVQFPPGTLVQQVTQRLTGLTTNVTLETPVDRSRTFVLAGGQWASGQVHGEGRHSTTATPTINDMRVEAELTNVSTLKLTRRLQNTSATFTVYVVQLKP